jgi:hypothetical protein
VTDGFAKDREIILFNNAGLQPSRRHCWRVVLSFAKTPSGAK